MTNDERGRLDAIEAKIDVVLVKLTYIERYSEDHEIRIRSVEKWKFAVPTSLLIGLAAVIGAIARAF
jgi:hypothetical protein